MFTRSLYQTPDMFTRSLYPTPDKGGLPHHIPPPGERAGEHRFPMHRHGLGLEELHVELHRIVDEAELALRRDDLCDLLEMVVRVGDAEDVAHGLEPERRHLLGHRLPVVDDVMGAEIEAPLP